MIRFVYALRNKPLHEVLRLAYSYKKYYLYVLNPKSHVMQSKWKLNNTQKLEIRVGGKNINPYYSTGFDQLLGHKGNNLVRHFIRKDHIFFAVFISHNPVAILWLTLGPNLAKNPFLIPLERNEAATWAQFVDPKFRRSGLGTVLLQSQIEFLKKHHKHIDHFYSWVKDNNTGSQRFHEKLGFLKIGSFDQKRIVGIVFWKRLKELKNKISIDIERK